MRKLTVCLAALILLAGCGGAASPASPPSGGPAAAKAATLERSQVASAYATTTGTTAPLWLAAEKGLFQKYGLTVTPQYAETSAVNASLLSGEVQLALGDAPSVLAADVAGASLKLIGAVNKSNPYSIVVRPDIKTAADLKGKSLALAKPGDTADVSARMALKPLGIQIGTDVTALSVGNSGPRLAALLSGQVAGAILSEGFVDQAVSQGMHVLVSLEKANIPYIALGVVVTDSFAKSSPNTITAYLKGFIEGVKFFSDENNKVESKAILASYLKTKPDDKVVEDSYAAYHNRVAHDPFPDKEGVDSALDALKTIDPGRYSSMSSESVLDTSFMTAIRASGFLKTVWGE